MARLFVIVATVGRAALTAQTVAMLERQTRRPDGVIVVGVTPGDVAGIGEGLSHVEVALGERGLPRQRNRGLDLLTGRADIVTFFDDDFVPARDHLEQVERIFGAHPDVAGITGHLVADGINEAGYSIAEAEALNAAQAAGLDPAFRTRQALYGCNMSIRLAAAEGLRFDERLPLYGWLEDIDFSIQLARRGRLVSTGRVTGVHLGTKGGRTSGRKLGYSQVANVVYLARKGTMQPGLGRQLLTQNLVSNLVRSVKPEPHIDRRGRLWGNTLAIADLVRGTIDPRRVETL
ncbi:glycosyltransferase family 2 protein [Sphingomonas radiodurans]|uniref:glycosyltransferase family 2 protein n=1 Tax=Sphingomonas radiodurans TaxID=2890321 RepID=UPI001E5A8732|nr:glycosyltransferase family A protein [Sphingomonas radiodurans]WBH17092.1 glycosyltransferase family A protein [Sphingomonas radiodurans]